VTRAAVDGIVAAALDPMLLVGLDGRILGWNAAAARLYGFAAAEIVGEPLGRLAPAGRPDDLVAALDRALRGLPPAPFPAERIGKDGSRVQVTVSLAPVRSRGGQLAAVAIVHRPATAQPPGEAPAAPDDAALRAAFDDLPVGVQWLSGDGTIEWANRAMFELLGYSAEDYLGREFAAFASEPELLRDVIARVLAGETVRAVEVGLRASDGSTRTMLGSATGRWAPDAFRIWWFSVDLGERDQAEPRRRVRELETVLDRAPALIWMTGPDGAIAFVNRAWLEFTGRALDEAVGAHWLDDVHPEDLPVLLDQFLLAFDRREPYRAEYRLRRHDGVYRWMLDRGVPIVTPTGEFAGCLGAAVDISEVRDAADERVRAAAHAARIEGVLLTAREMSHLLNNSITGAIGSLELLAHNRQDERYQALIPGALAGLEAAARYLRDLQNVVRVETKQTPVGEALDLGRSTAERG
jgi:PAS domain S-box-containing protein